METLEATKDEKDVIATLSLLTMVIKSVPQPVLRKKFADTGDIFLQLFEQFADNEHQNVLRSVSEICNDQYYVFKYSILVQNLKQLSLNLIKIYLF